MRDKNNAVVRVSAPARLHFGFLDLHGGYGRLFGSLGVSLHDISTDLDVRHSQKLMVSGPGAGRARKYAERILAHLNIRSGLRMHIHRAIPEHAGLGSGTQMALAVGNAVSQLFDENLGLNEIVRILDRGNRSGIGIGAFKGGGFIVDAGRSSATEMPPIISQLHFPDSWRFVLVLDNNSKGVHGQQEQQAFDGLAKMEKTVSANLCRLLIMQVLPSIAERDCSRFGSAITEIQGCMGEYFKSTQSGIYASADVGKVLEQLQGLGACGVGQSSWGPTGFAIYASETDAYQGLKEIRRRLPGDNTLELMICRARNDAATITLEDESYSENLDIHNRR